MPLQRSWQLFWVSGSLSAVLDNAPTYAAFSALARGLGGDATRLLYTLGWHEVPLPPSGDDVAPVNGTWLIAGFDELAAKVPGCIPFDRTDDSQPLGQVLGLQTWQAPPAQPLGQYEVVLP